MFVPGTCVTASMFSHQHWGHWPWTSSSGKHWVPSAPHEISQNNIEKARSKSLSPVMRSITCRVQVILPLWIRSPCVRYTSCGVKRLHRTCVEPYSLSPYTLSGHMYVCMCNTCVYIYTYTLIDVFTHSFIHYSQIPAVYGLLWVGFPNQGRPTAPFALLEAARYGLAINEGFQALIGTSLCRVVPQWLAKWLLTREMFDIYD